MPPKVKYSREEIVSAALSVIRENGADALTARSLGAKLGTSARPIFTAFKSMDEVQTEVLRLAKNLYAEYVEQGLAEPMRFKGVGKQYILFAINEPKLFQLLFMKEQSEMPDISSILPVIDENYEAILSSVERDYGFDRPNAEQLYRHLWIYTHGIATLCATGMCRFSAEEIGDMMTEVCRSLIMQMKEKRYAGQ